MRVRPAAVAGTFYPGEAAVLREQLMGFMEEAAAAHGDEPAPKAFIAPHAGTIYSGPIAASAYVRLRKVRDTVRRVVLLGPAHRVALHGIAASSAHRFATPLGEVALDTALREELLALPQVHIDDEAHRLEHSLEVHLPFLQQVLGEFQLLPLVVGNTPPVKVAEVIDYCWGGAETLVVVSSDLSHFQRYEQAQVVDAATSRMFEELNYQRLSGERACGVYPVSGLLLSLRRRGLDLRAIDVRNSGDTAGSRDQVVGYGAYVCT